MEHTKGRRHTRYRGRIAKSEPTREGSASGGFTSGSVGRAPGNRCLYPKEGPGIDRGIKKRFLFCQGRCFKVLLPG